MITPVDEEEDEPNTATSVCLYQPKSESMKHKEMFCRDKMEDMDIYSKDNEEIYIATSPSFSEVDAKSIDEVYSGAEHDSCSNLSDSKQSTNFEDETNTSHADFQCSTKDESLAYNSKVINTYPAISTGGGQGYLVSPDFSQLNNLGIEVSKTFYYVLSPMGTVNTLIRASTEGEDKHINLVSEEQEVLEDDEITPRLVAQNHEEVMKDNETEYCLNEFDQEAEHIDLAQTEIASDDHLHTEEHVHMQGDFENLNQEYQVNFIHGIPDQVDSSTKERTQLVWQPLTTSGQDHQKNAEKGHTVLMKYDHTSKMELPIIHGQPYLQVALVNDLEPAATSELVSTDQILGVTVPEIFTCKWESCGTHFLTKNDLVKHVNSTHVNADVGVRYVCHWKGCVREGKEFDARYKLLIHLRTHTGEKPHNCPVEGCTAAFSRIENLKIHVRTHTGERPYPCQYEGCNKSFANSSDRFKHRRTHTEKKPYRCPMKGCEKSYTDPSSLRKHRKRHTEKTSK